MSPNIVDIRFFGIVLLKLLHFGNEVEPCGEDEREIEKKYIPSWCPQTYKQLVEFCIFLSPQYGEKLKIEFLEPAFHWD